jgi:hypothetical protein
MPTPRTGLTHRRPKSNLPEQIMLREKAHTRAKTEAEAKVDAVLQIGHIKLNKPGRAAAVMLTGSMSAPTASDMMIIALFGQVTDTQARLTRLGTKACPKERARTTALMRSLLKDLSARARDRDLRVSAFEPEVPAPQSSGKTNTAEVIDWVAVAAKEVPWVRQP